MESRLPPFTVIFGTPPRGGSTLRERVRAAEQTSCQGDLAGRTVGLIPGKGAGFSELRPAGTAPEFTAGYMGRTGDRGHGV